MDFTTSVATTGGGWLSATTTKAAAYSTLTLTPDISKLGPGAYTGTVTITPIPPASLPTAAVTPTVIPVSLMLSALPLISANQFCCGFTILNPPGPPGNLSQTLTISSNGDAAPVTVSVNPSSGGNWLSVTPLTGTTPLTLTLTANPSGLSPGSTPYVSQITIQGPNNTLTFNVNLNDLGPPQFPPGTTLQATPSSFAFQLQAGTPPSTSAAASINFPPFSPFITSVQTG